MGEITNQTIDSHEVLDAFADGERVNAPALRAALEDAAGRDYLIDLLALRGLVQDHIRLDAAALDAPPRPTPVPTAARALRAVAAIVVLALAGAGGFAAGRRSEDKLREADAAIAAPTAIPAAIDTSDAPEPTRVIRFEPGVDWRQRSGGH